jgi:hypothetical protein
VTSWDFTISVLCLLAACFLCWRERQRRNRSRYVLRCFASILTIAGLWGMGFQIKNPAKEDKPSGADTLATQTKIPQKKERGFLDIHWRERLYSGQPLIVQGRFINDNPGGITIRLNGFGNSLDSVNCPSGKEQSFTLQTIPKQTGKSVYQIVVSQGKNLLETEPLPVAVQPQSVLNMLILSSYPDFENKFLDRWLKENRMTVARRTRISRDRSEKTFINRSPVEFNRLNDSLLQQFDWMMCDASAFASLSDAEQISIRRQVNENGMGLMIRVDTVLKKKTFFDLAFPCHHFSSKANEQLRLIIPDSSRSIAYSENKDGIEIRFQPGTQPLINDNEGRVRVSSQLYGNGKIACTTLANTFEWSLGGKELDYGWFWTYLIQKTAKHKTDYLQAWVEEPFPVKDRPVHIVLDAANVDPPHPKMGATPFYLRQQKNLPSLWNGIYWPKQSGWQPALHAGNRFVEWYVFEAKDWAPFTTQEIPDLIEKKAHKGKGNLLLFFIIFMSGWCFLWLERKLSLI